MKLDLDHLKGTTTLMSHCSALDLRFFPVSPLMINPLNFRNAFYSFSEVYYTLIRKIKLPAFLLFINLLGSKQAEIVLPASCLLVVLWIKWTDFSNNYLIQSVPFIVCCFIYIFSFEGVKTLLNSWMEGAGTICCTLSPVISPTRRSTFLSMKVKLSIFHLLFLYQTNQPSIFWQMTLPIIFAQHKVYRWSPQVSAWKTADSRGTSRLINSRHKQECFPCTDWYTPPFASLASRDVRPCERYGNSGTTCSNTGLVCDLSAGTVSLFMWQYLNPLPTGVQAHSDRHPYGNGL